MKIKSRKRTKSKIKSKMRTRAAGFCLPQQHQILLLTWALPTAQMSTVRTPVQLLRNLRRSSGERA